MKYFRAQPGNIFTFAALNLYRLNYASDDSSIIGYQSTFT